ncbi:MAG: hypothetical protein Q4C77_12435 [Eubacteriales bacterium]|nr:hypothetical protein [Eubacteriales bacterium]
MKVKQKLKHDIIPAIRIYLGFPQIKVFIAILILAIMSFAGAYLIEDMFWSSICANIFAGLVTGIVLFLLTGVKQIYIARQELKYQWLKKIHDQIIIFNDCHRKMMLNNNDIHNVEFENAIYDTICAAHDVNVYIESGERDRRLGFNTLRYCKNQYEYDARDKSDRDDKVRGKIISSSYESKQDADTLFDSIKKDLFTLNHQIVTEMSDIEVKLKIANRSII